MSEAFNAERLTRLCDFLQQSPTPWHATQSMAERLEQAGFTRLEETANWQLVPGKRYYVTRNDSSVIAFQLPAGKLTSLRMLGAHTDSPGLRLKPNATQYSAGWLQLGVQVYGGVLLAPGLTEIWAWRAAFTCAMPMVAWRACCSTWRVRLR